MRHPVSTPRRATARSLVALLALAAGLVVASDHLDAAESVKLRHVTAIYLDDKGAGLKHPEGVACNDRGTLIVADTGGRRLVRYSVDERSAKPVGEIAGAELQAPLRVRVTSRDEIYVLDGKQRRIVRFGANGASRGALRPDGVPGEPTIVPRSFAIDAEGTIYLADVFGARLLVLDAEGRYQRHLDFPRDAGFVSDVAVDARGTVFLLDSVKAVVYTARKNAKEFTPLGKDLRAQASFLTSLAIDARGVLFLADRSGATLLLLGPDGAVLGRQLARGWNEGLLRAPAQLCVNDRGQLFVADRGNSRVQMFAIVR